MPKLREKISQNKFICAIRNTMMNIKPKGLKGGSLYEVFRFYSIQSQRIGFSMRASAISFNMLMAIPAGLIFLCTLVPYAPESIHFQDEIENTLNQVVKDPRTLTFLVGLIDDFFTKQRSGLLSFSFIAALFFSSNAMMGIMRCFDKSYFESRKKYFLAKRLTAIKLTCLIIVLLTTFIVVISTNQLLKNYLQKQFIEIKPILNFGIDVIRWLLLFSLNFFIISVIYRYAPAVKNKWSIFSPGAIVACVLTILTTWGFGVWVNNFANFNKIYGSIGTLLIIMNLLYINALALLIGFELNVSITAVKNKHLKTINS